jgi:hypothetical protein
MSNISHGPVTGGLFGWRNAAAAQKLLDTEGLRVSPAAATGWQALDVDKNGASPFHYQFLLRLSGTHAILVSSEGDLVQSFLRASHVTSSMVMPRVFVDNLVNKFAEQPDDRFVLGGVYARVDGYGNSLRTIALWGADVTDTQLFRLVRGNLGPYRVDLRDLKRGVPLLSISSRGELSFNYDGSRSLLDVTATLEVLTREEYIAWPL